MAVAMMGGLDPMTRFSPSFWITTPFVIAVSCALGIVLVRSKASWIVAGVLCAIMSNVLLIPFWLKHGFFGPSALVMSVEWFVVGTISGLVANLVPDRRDPGSTTRHQR